MVPGIPVIVEILLIKCTGRAGLLHIFDEGLPVMPAQQRFRQNRKLKKVDVRASEKLYRARKQRLKHNRWIRGIQNC